MFFFVVVFFKFRQQVEKDRSSSVIQGELVSNNERLTTVALDRHATEEVQRVNRKVAHFGYLCLSLVMLNVWHFIFPIK